MGDWRRSYAIAVNIRNLRESRKEAFWAAIAATVIAMDIPDWMATVFAVLAVVALLIAAWAQWYVIAGKRLLAKREAR